MEIKIMNWYNILLVMKYILIIIPISILINNGFILEGGFLALYLFIEILSQRIKRLEEKLDKLENGDDKNG